ncbi:MAG: glycosyltransferase family 2 protein [Prevotella sp.]|nr:glycosyltransferase family 2 protein [Prevotella sp.]
MEKLAIVILNWNGKQMLQTYLPKVLACSRDEAVVYVADNASTDDSLAMLNEKFPEVRQIVLDKNWGFADGYNKALARVDAEYYVLLNSDVEVTPGWLKPLVSFMDAHPEVGACQPKLLSVADKSKFEYAGACGGFLDRYGYPYCRGRVFDTVEQDNGQYDDIHEVLWTTGACMMVRSKDYWAVNGLDGRFFAHNEEIDMCWRMRMMGRQLFCIPQSKVYHVGGGTLPKGSPMKTYLNFRNNLTMLYKNLPEKELRYVMRVRWFLDYVAAWQTLILNRNVGDFKAIYRARHDFMKWRTEFRPERKEHQIDRVEPRVPRTLRTSFCLVWQYYARGRKKYTDLPQ